MGDTRPKGLTARPFVPDSRDIESLRRAAAACKGCDLYKHATQTVFGRGAAPAAIMLIGEQPGDQEDRQPRGKRRIHQTPRISEIKACMPWTEAEIASVATWHPSAVLRTHDDPAEARQMFDELAGDLRLAARHSKKKK